MKAFLFYPILSRLQDKVYRPWPLILAILLFAGLNGSAQKIQSAENYFSFVTGEFRMIEHHSWNYVRAAAKNGKTERTEEKRKQMLAAYQLALSALTDLPAYNGSTALRDSAVIYVNMALAVMNENYALLTDFEKVSDAAYDSMEAYLLAKETSGEKLKTAAVMIRRELNRFTSEHRIKTNAKQDKLTRKLARAAEVQRYYNDVYLIFFMNYKQEAAMLSAMAGNDVSGLEQSRDALARISAKGIKKLEEMPAYLRDASLVTSCRNMLLFYNGEASEKMVTAPAYLVQRDHLIKLKKSYDLKSPEERSPEDSNLYNTQKHAYVMASLSFQKTLTELQHQRSVALRQWNNTCSQFTRRHIH